LQKSSRTPKWDSEHTKHQNECSNIQKIQIFPALGHIFFIFPVT
jgi:hypothetical protein